MKKYRFLFIILLPGLFLYLALFLTGGKINEEKDEEHPLIPSQALSVPLPGHIDFCGSRISLSRLDMRERFDREINGFTYLHSTTLLYFKRANRFFPLIEPILKENEIPSDFKYLCVIESNLDTRAFSPAKAAGLWQFMDVTGKSYGLEITDEVDERYHIEKATEAACRYFKSAYSLYGNWVDVAASYNAGMSRITRAKQEQIADSAFDLLLVPETSRYVFRILALKEIFEHPRKYGFLLRKENLYPPVPVRPVEVTADIENLAIFAKEHEISYMQLKEFNVWLRGNSLKVAKGKSYTIGLPNKKDLEFDARNLKVHDKRWIE
jgi:hypothetical protein